MFMVVAEEEESFTGGMSRQKFFKIADRILVVEHSFAESSTHS
jgi:hypothetical protein